jgi:phosphate starvation-inducible membrane PsiE
MGVIFPKIDFVDSLALMEAVSLAFSARNIANSRNPYFLIKPIVSLFIFFNLFA